ncbi:hypothetical protein TWF481_004093 [Arthrobotrys musiformis]|uniref:Uncharacterized protein n=1 Tax=Arthrobotrys musiformis TaxID=47236 RepID=A0AAV9WII1_9PEZI
MHLIPLVVLSALLASPVFSSPIKTNDDVKILLSREALAEIPHFNITKRHDPGHHREIGITPRGLLSHLHTNYAHRNFIRDVIVDDNNRTFTTYDIPDDLMDHAVSTYPLHKRHASIVKDRVLRKRAEIIPEPFGPLEKRELERRSSVELSSVIITKLCNAGKKVVNDLYDGALGFFCVMHNEAIRFMIEGNGSGPSPYTSYGPWNYADGGEGDMVFTYGKGQGFPWAWTAFTCKPILGRLENCAGVGLADGGALSTQSKNGNGAFHYGVDIGDISKGQPFESG